MPTILWVGAAGFLGAMARYGVAGLVSRVDETFPWGTFVINVSGSFLLGLLVSAFAHHIVVHPDLRVAVTVGFLGSYTTFSTLMLETWELGEAHALGVAIANVAFSLVVGLLAVGAGLWLGRNL
jgi:CrcB protein